MSAATITPDDRSALAAEFVLGLVSGEDLALARDLAANDPPFRTEVGRWTRDFAPLLDEFAPAEPREDLLSKIEQRIGFLDSKGDQGRLRRSRNIWRAVSAGASAIAASLAFMLVTRPPDVRYVERPGADPMFAMLGDKGAPAQLVAAWNPAERRLTVTPASATAPGAARSHQLWIIPADGTPRSLGLLPTDGQMRGNVEPSIVALFGEGATIAISLEPSGGSPTGQPTGPVIAAGKLQRT